MVCVHYFGMGGHEHGRERMALSNLVPFDVAVSAGVFAPMLVCKRSKNSAGYNIGLAEVISYLKVGPMGGGLRA
jgi:hypothetical protein